MRGVGHAPVPRRIGVQAFLRLAERWGLDRGDLHVLLGRNSPNTIRNWIKAADHDRERDVRLEADVQERLSHLVAIYDGLHRLFGDAAYADAWIRTENRAFGGQTPLSRMLSGQFADLYEVRLYIERSIAA
ncbi:MAG: antitoxin Xre/MbcA/ParS toxin-binding domain-containing protein [Vulcanimicrobiaceae bacterium]